LQRRFVFARCAGRPHNAGVRPPDPTDPSDDELLARVRAGHGEAVRQLVHRYDRLVRYTVFRAARRQCLRDPQWLDSVASEVWTGLLRSLNTGVPPSGKLTAYLIQITRNKCADAARRRPDWAAPPADLTDALEPTIEHSDPGELLSRAEDLSNLRDCITHLRDDQRRLCGEIVAITEHKWREAAERLGMAESTLRSQWQGVMESLRRCMRAKKR
jgi:RNA polymerase sigma factor (sigma-70 family)